MSMEDLEALMPYIQFSSAQTLISCRSMGLTCCDERQLVHTFSFTSTSPSPFLHHPPQPFSPLVFVRVLKTTPTSIFLIETNGTSEPKGADTFINPRQELAAQKVEAGVLGVAVMRDHVWKVVDYERSWEFGCRRTFLVSILMNFFLTTRAVESRAAADHSLDLLGWECLATDRSFWHVVLVRNHLTFLPSVVPIRSQKILLLRPLDPYWLSAFHDLPIQHLK